MENGGKLRLLCGDDGKRSTLPLFDRTGVKAAEICGF